jgi:magnesium transporter
MLKSTDLNAPVTAHMNTECTRLAEGQTVGETLEMLRREPPGERIIYFYVVDRGGHLHGVVPTRKLLLSPPEARVDEIMVPRTVALPSTATVRDACELFAMHRFLALPVVDAERRLLGVVDIELYTDELDQLTDAEVRSDLFQAIGVYAGAEADPSALKAFARRFPWLGSNLAGGLLCAVMASRFQAELGHVVALAMFIPVVLTLSESVSSQSVSLTLHLLHGQQPAPGFMRRGLRQELATGLMLGSACGGVVGVAALVWLGQPHVALAVLLGIGIGVSLSAILGLALPVTLRRLKLDPKVAAGPVALATTDVATLFAYLASARWLLS